MGRRIQPILRAHKCSFVALVVLVYIVQPCLGDLSVRTAHIEVVCTARVSVYNPCGGCTGVSGTASLHIRAISLLVGPTDPREGMHHTKLAML